MAAVERAPAIVTRHEEARSGWELARREPHPALAAHVAEYCGYEEWSADPFRRREVAHGRVVLIVSFGDRIAVDLSNARTPPVTVRSFVAGLQAGYAITEYRGRQQGLQIDLTPVGAYRLLGVPMGDIANQVVPLDALHGRAADRLAEQLAGAAGWDARLDLAERWLLESFAGGPMVDDAVEWSWRQLERSHGLVAINDLVREVGWSARHFSRRFHAQIGLLPKTTARVVRFRRAVESLGSSPGLTIADIAATCGYADHSHLVRDFKEFAGVAPTAYLDAQLPDSGGVAA